MGTVVYQGCLHDSLIKLRLSSHKPHFSPFLELPLKHCFLDSSTTKLSDDAKCQYEEISQKTNIFHKSSNTTPDSGGWSFLQALSNSSCDDTKESTKKQSTYVHPLVKRSSSTLSEKSLELCTESLGSETGTDIIEDSIFSMSQTNPITPSNEGISPTREQKIIKTRQPFGAYTKASSRSFPPPLTTMSGSKSIQVRPHREDGRLIIEAIKTTSTHTYFHAERSHGRLRLSFVKDSTPTFDSTSVTSIEDNKEADEIESDVINYEDDKDEEEIEEEEEEEEEEVEEEMDGNKMEVNEEMGMDEFQRPSRCKQGELENHKGIISNWEHLYVGVTTS